MGMDSNAIIHHLNIMATSNDDLNYVNVHHRRAEAGIKHEIHI